MVYPVLLPLMGTPRLPVVDRTDAPADLNGLVRFAERQNLVSARVPSYFKRSLLSTDQKMIPARNEIYMRMRKIFLANDEFLLSVLVALDHYTLLEMLDVFRLPAVEQSGAPAYSS